jgi:cell division protein FtsB
MSTRAIPAALIALLLILHAQLWFGRGSVPSVNRLERDLAAQKMSNQQAALVNTQIEAEIRDLREGLEIVEEKARSELGMVQANEIFVQIAR